MKDKDTKENLVGGQRVLSGERVEGPLVVVVAVVGSLLSLIYMCVWWKGGGGVERGRGGLVRSRKHSED